MIIISMCFNENPMNRMQNYSMIETSFGLCGAMADYGKVYLICLTCKRNEFIFWQIMIRDLVQFWGSSK